MSHTYKIVGYPDHNTNTYPVTIWSGYENVNDAIAALSAAQTAKASHIWLDDVQKINGDEVYTSVILGSFVRMAVEKEHPTLKS